MRDVSIFDRMLELENFIEAEKGNIFVSPFLSVQYSRRGWSAQKCRPLYSIYVELCRIIKPLTTIVFSVKLCSFLQNRGGLGIKNFSSVINSLAAGLRVCMRELVKLSEKTRALCVST